MGVASTLPNVCDKALLFIIETPVMTTLQFSQIVSPLDEEESPVPMKDQT
jgi:hypothetical protein